MSWAKFPYPDAAFRYDEAALHKAWPHLHAGDLEPWPPSQGLVDAWIAFHAGEFDGACKLGLDEGVAGYAVANKAAAIHAVYLEKTAARKMERLLQVARRCEEQQAAQPGNPAAFYWHGYALVRYSQEISMAKALAEGIAGKVRASLERTLELAPRHADAHVTLGIYHAGIVEKVGELVARLTWSVGRDEAVRHFQAALELNPESVVARIEYADALVMLDGQTKVKQAIVLCQQAAAIVPQDALERLEVERAKHELG